MTKEKWRGSAIKCLKNKRKQISVPTTLTGSQFSFQFYNRNNDKERKIKEGQKKIRQKDLPIDFARIYFLVVGFYKDLY